MCPSVVFAMSESISMCACYAFVVVRVPAVDVQILHWGTNVLRPSSSGLIGIPADGLCLCVYLSQRVGRLLVLTACAPTLALHPPEFSQVSESPPSIIDVATMKMTRIISKPVILSCRCRANSHTTSLPG